MKITAEHIRKLAERAIARYGSAGEGFDPHVLYVAALAVVDACKKDKIYVKTIGELENIMYLGVCGAGVLTNSYAGLMTEDNFYRSMRTFYDDDMPEEEKDRFSEVIAEALEWPEHPVIEVKTLKATRQHPTADRIFRITDKYRTGMQEEEV